jgi:hypothetical protein
MSSFTSNSESTSRARAARIALLLVAALALVEWGTREQLVPGSSDQNRYYSFPGRAQSLVAAPAPRIALIGNSVTDRVALELLTSEWQDVTGEAVAVDKFVAYYSNLTTWYWMANEFFWKENLEPDLIVVTYYDEVGLADAPLMEVGTLAQFFTDPGDRPLLFAHDLKSVELRANYLLSSASLAFATTDRIRDRALNFIPGYRPFATTTNEFNFRHEQDRRRSMDKPAPTFDTLRRFVARARQKGVRVCFVAFRSRPGESGAATYGIHPEVLEVIADAGMVHLDLREMDELSADMYQDKVHLNARGQPLYTRRLARELTRIWQAP